MTLLDAHPLVQVGRTPGAPFRRKQGFAAKNSKGGAAGRPARPPCRRPSPGPNAWRHARPHLQVRQLSNPRGVYEQLMDMLARLASLGLVHCDYNEFNLLVSGECVRVWGGVGG